MRDAAQFKNVQFPQGIKNTALPHGVIETLIDKLMPICRKSIALLALKHGKGVLHRDGRFLVEIL